MNMKKIMMAAGGMVAAVAVCCVDSDGIYGMAAVLICIAGATVALLGQSLYQKEKEREAWERKKKQRRAFAEAGAECVKRIS